MCVPPSAALPASPSAPVYRAHHRGAGARGHRPAAADATMTGLQRLARLRVPLGFLFGACVFYFAHPTWRTLAAGAAIGLLGESIRLWAAGHLEKSREVTRSGPYRYTRHPLYLGSSVMGAGVAV